MTCRYCGERFDRSGTVHGQEACLWDYLQHLRDEHGEG